MADARENYFPDEIRHIIFHYLHLLTPEAENAVALARDEQGRLAQLDAAKKF
jgi:hypothetical protein